MSSASLVSAPAREDTAPPAAVAIVGAGPKGVGVLERICASARAVLGDRDLVVHLVDPFPPGPGRVWRYDQSPLLLMNSQAQDVTVFTDDTVVCVGPIHPGPTLAEWTDQVRTGALHAALDAGQRAELTVAKPTTFHSRRLHSGYLNWYYQDVLANRPANVEIRVHATEAVDLGEDADGGQQVWLADDPGPLRVDAVVLALGHLEAAPAPAEHELVEFADRHGLGYVPPAYTADVDFSAVQPGESVLVRGFGLAFIDLMALLTEGRGGRFATAPDGTMTYHPSGAEPRLHVGSRRGVPYQPKTGYALQAAPAVLPRFFGPEHIDELVARPGTIGFRTDLWPLIAKEIGWGYYTELFTAHPDRVTMSFAEFTDHYTGLDWASAGMLDLVAAAVPAPADRLDLAALDRPLAHVSAADRAGLGRLVRGHVEAALDRRADPGFSADLGAVMAMLSVFRQLPRVVASGRLDPASQVQDVDGWWFGLFGYLGSGPPPHRLHELLALEAAGIVTFVGPDMWVRADEQRGVFVGGSTHAPGEVVATTLVDARLPRPSVVRCTNPLVRALYRKGELSEERLGDGESTRLTGRIHTSGLDAKLVRADGRPHPRRFTVGPHTSVRAAGAFSRPRTNALGFRENDLVAQQVLEILGRLPVH